MDMYGRTPPTAMNGSHAPPQWTPGDADTGLLLQGLSLSLLLLRFACALTNKQTKQSPLSFAFVLDLSL